MKLSEVSSELTFQIPMAESDKFAEFFTDLDSNIEKLRIKSYGVSVTTLEEVFLKVGHQVEDDQESDQQYEETKEVIEDPHVGNKVNESADQDVDDYSIAEDHEKWVFWIHYYALCVKKFLVSFRQLRSAIIEILIPMIFILLGLALSNVSFFKDSLPFVLDSSFYPQNNKLYLSSTRQIPELQNYADSFGDAYDVELVDFPEGDTLLQRLLDHEASLFNDKGAYDPLVQNSGNHILNNINTGVGRCGVIGMINGHGRDATPLHVSLMINS